MNTPVRSLAGVTLAILLLNGCGPRIVVPGVATPAPPAVNVGAPPTDDEVVAFGQRFETAMREENEDAVRDCLRLDDLIDRSVSDLKLNPQLRAGFRKGAVGAVGKVTAELTAIIKDGGTCKFLRARPLDGKPAVLFRIRRVDGGMDYLQLPVVRHADGTVAAADLYLFMSGELKSLTMRRLVIQIVASLDQGLAGKLSGQEREVLDNLTKVQTLQQQVKGGKPHAALATYRSLPPRLQTEKAIQLFGLVAASEAGEAEYLAEMERYRAAHPNDPSLAILSIDFHLLRKEYDACLKALDEIDAAVGGDPYLQLLRAQVRIQEGKFEAAQVAAEKAIRDDPTAREGYTTAALAAVKQNRHADAARYFRQMVEKADAVPDFDVIRTEGDWAAFAASPQLTELERWFKSRKK